MATPSELFFEKTQRKSVYNIQPIGNIPSVICHGLLSYNRVAKIDHESIAMPDVQRKRNNIQIPHGGPLHAYANAYFDPRNPMMYRKHDIAQSLCVLAISSKVLDLPGTIISDGNAASPFSRFYTPIDGVNQLDFVRIYDEWWISEDPCEQLRRKRIKCAEILVPNRIDYGYIVGAIVVSEQAQRELKSKGFDKKIAVRPKVFFWREG